MLYPLKFNKVFVEKIWGGRSFETVLHMPLPKDRKNYGESWEVSALHQGMSIVSNGPLKGQSLQQVLEQYKEALVGNFVYESFENEFPLLIKYLDINDKLSVQVHPDNVYALEHENSFGKAECWYVMDASSDAKIIYGLAEEITREDFIEKVQNQDFKNLFNEVEVKTGDFVYVEPGTVHASLTGRILIAEIQQSSDVTYRIYDFDRIDATGVKRPLHVKKSAAVIEFGKANLKERIVNLKEIEQGKILETPYFSVEKVNVKVMDVHREKGEDTFHILSVLEGKGAIKCQGMDIAFHEGESVLVPAHLDYDVIGEISYLKSYMD